MLPSNGSRELKEIARENIDRDYELNTVTRPFRNKVENLEAIKEKNVDLNSLYDDYTDIRYDDVSGQNVGFPKVNGYMEVPLPLRYPNELSLEQRAYLQNTMGNNRLQRPKEPRKNSMGYYSFNPYQYINFGNPLTHKGINNEKHND